MEINEINLKLSKVQSKAIIALAKADAKSIKLIIATLLNQGIYWDCLLYTSPSPRDRG